MPIYAYRCPSCGDEREEFRKIKDRLDAPSCDCSEFVGVSTVMQPVVSAPHVMPDMAPYKSMITGEMIRSRSHHREHLRDHGCIEVGNETGYFKRKDKVEISKESKQERKRQIIEKVNAIK